MGADRAPRHTGQPRWSFTVIPIADTDIVPLEAFPLAWRFVGPRHGAWPPERLNRLRPLSTSAAASVASYALDACRDPGAKPVTFRGDDPPDLVRQRLEALPPLAAESVVVSWNATTALLTDWEVVTAHWDDFCYPSSDDVTIMSLDQRWVLCYWRYDLFQFRAS